ncbi:MAG: FkbM family methyltransferase [Alphaproteobacteria bacterium]|nr:FkbM family methyltransferase [Alphaproteobacteria bacterium]
MRTQFDVGALKAVPTLASAIAAGDPATLATLLEVRRGLVRAILDGAVSPDDVAAMPETAALAQAGITRFPSDPADRALAAEACGRFAEPSGLLAAALLVPPVDLPSVPDLGPLSGPLREVLATLLLTAPALFSRLGEGELYAERLETIVEAIHRVVVGRPEDPERMALGMVFAQRSNLLMAYFSTRNLRRMLRLRGEIVETMLVTARRRPAFAFGERRPGKVRVGLLIHALPPFTETYLAVSQFEARSSDIHLTIYTVEAAPGPIEDLARAKADAFVRLDPDLNEQIRHIRADDLDAIVVHSNVSAIVNPVAILSACRLARVQIVSSATPTSSGFAVADAYLSGVENEPGTDPQGDYVEHLHRMPGYVNYYAFQHDHSQATLAPTRAALGLPEDAPVFFSGANFFKLGPEVTALWARLLATVPDAQLLIMPFAPSWSANYHSRPFFDRIAAQFEAVGVGRERWKAAQPVPSRADLHRIAALADVYIDAHPFSGACSLIDPLTVGLPVVTLAGTRFRGHVGAAMLSGAGLGDFVARDEDEYLAKAAALARDTVARRMATERVRAAMRPTLPYFDVATAGRKFADAAISLVEARVGRMARLRASSTDQLVGTIARLAAELAGTPLLRGLTDTEILHLFVLPYLRDACPAGHAIDVGACVGEMSIELLEAGWTADLFEPDPACAPAMARIAGHFGARARHHAALVGETSGEGALFRSDIGLSGRAPSAFGATADIVRVPSVRLDEFAARQGIERVDWLKVDCEGYDFDALESHDFTRLPPRLALVEYTTAHARQSEARTHAVIDAMRARGYAALVFSYEDAGNFARRNWDHWCIGLTAGTLTRCAAGHSQGNILFYRADDAEFLARAAMTLADILPGAAREGVLGF